MKVDIKKSTNSEKKLMAIFYDGDKKIKILSYIKNVDHRKIKLCKLFRFKGWIK